MAAATTPRNTPQMGVAPGVIPARVSVPVADNVKLLPGTIAVIKAGYASPAVLETGDLPAGMVGSESGSSAGMTAWDNTVTGHAAGAFEVPIEQGVFKWANAGTITQANVGGVCYAADNQTVTATATGASVVGKILRVDSDGVWVLSYLGMTNS